MINENALRLLEQRYFLKDIKGNILENWEQLVRRVVLDNCRNEEQSYIDKMESYMNELMFLPNSPCLVNSGKLNAGKFACFVASPTEDTLENHLDALKDIAQVAKRGGGIGFSGDNIRPKNKPVAGSAHGYSYGSVKWAKAVSGYMDMMTQSGFRKMALMFSLSSNHEDIEDFIDAKQTVDEKDMYNFNQSVMATDDFMTKAIADETSNEHRLLNKIAKNAWSNGEPGLLFYDTINNNSPYKYSKQEMISVNPCGEQPLPQYGSCNLGSINIGHINFFNVYNEFNYDLFKEVVMNSIQFLDNVGTYNVFPNDDFKNWYENNRPVGLGLMGVADALIKLNIRYGSKEAVAWVKDLVRKMYLWAEEKSIQLGKERGIPKSCRVFPNYIQPRRNITLLTMAPTGSISFIANCSFGGEPIYSKSYQRVDERGEVYFVEHELSNSQAFITTNELTWREHIDMQYAFQESIDSAVSKTINMPNHATVEDVLEAYKYAWLTGCKGITVYRDNSRQIQVLTHVAQEEFKDETTVAQHNQETCPNCSSDSLINIEGCKTCSNCGYSVCSLK